tara:strand:+ start:99 stop:269 length:171 start_codon:yes stop_codon:yes gene_type:complete
MGRFWVYNDVLVREKSPIWPYPLALRTPTYIIMECGGVRRADDGQCHCPAPRVNRV